MPFFVAADYDAVIEPLFELMPATERPRYNCIRTGQHLTNQLLRDFAYLRQRYDEHALTLDFAPSDGNLFELSKRTAEAVDQAA